MILVEEILGVLGYTPSGSFSSNETSLFNNIPSLSISILSSLGLGLSKIPNKSCHLIISSPFIETILSSCLMSF